MQPAFRRESLGCVQAGEQHLFFGGRHDHDGTREGKRNDIAACTRALTAKDADLFAIRFQTGH